MASESWFTEVMNRSFLLVRMVHRRSFSDRRSDRKILRLEYTKILQGFPQKILLTGTAFGEEDNLRQRVEQGSTNCLLSALFQILRGIGLVEQKIGAVLTMMVMECKSVSTILTIPKYFINKKIMGLLRASLWWEEARIISNAHQINFHCCSKTSTKDEA